MVQRAASPVRLQQKPDYSENGNPLIDMASNCSAELQRPYPGLTERRGVGGGSPRFAFCTDHADPARRNDGLANYPIK